MNRWLTILALLGFVAGSDAQTEMTATNRTVITSERLDFDYQRLFAEFSGNVVVQTPQLEIKSDKLTVLFRKDNTLKSLTAVGNVRIEQGDKKATCRMAVYTAVTREIVLTGDASIERGADLLVGDIITFWIGEERVTCVPGYLRIVPGEFGGIKSPLEW